MKSPVLPLLTVAALAAGAHAQPDPFVRPLPPAAAGTEALGRFLHELGYAPKALSPDVYQVTVERDRWPVHVMLSLSTDGRRVWLESKFAPIEDPDKVPPQAWKRLLEANEKVGPAHFAFDKSDRRIHLYKSFDNHGVSAARLKAELEQFDQTVRKTQDYWRGDNFKPVIASTDPALDPAKVAVPTAKGASQMPPNAPELPAAPVTDGPTAVKRLEGEWTVIEIQVKGRKTPDEVVKERKARLTVYATHAGHIQPSGGLAVSERVVGELRFGPDGARTFEVRLVGLRQIDFVDDRDGAVERGIYKFDGETLTLCFAAPGEPWPAEFKSTEQSKTTLLMLKKAK